jgi:chromosome segregation ATPase
MARGTSRGAEEPALAEAGLGSLSARESELLKTAGERVFDLSRRLAEKDKETERLKSDLAGLRELLAETRSSRDILANQVLSLQRELEREFEERSELRRLLSSLHLQLQTMMSPAGTLSPQSRLAPQHSSAQKALPAPARRPSWSERVLQRARLELRGIRSS